MLALNCTIAEGVLLATYCPNHDWCDESDRLDAKTALLL